MLNKKGQIDHPGITLVIVIFGLLLIAPIVLKIFNTVKAPVSAGFGNISNGGTVAAQNFNKVMDTGINFWDKIIIAAFIIAVILLLISSFLIDTSPFWVVLYVFISFMLILFAPSMVGTLDKIYDSPAYATEVAQLSFTNALRTHFGEFLVGIFVITGIIIYGKIRFFSGGNNRK